GVQHRREHVAALSGEAECRLTPAAPPFTTGKFAGALGLFQSQLKNKVLGKSLRVSLHRLIDFFHRGAIDHRQIAIEHEGRATGKGFDLRADYLNLVHWSLLYGASWSPIGKISSTATPSAAAIFFRSGQTTRVPLIAWHTRRELTPIFRARVPWVISRSTIKCFIFFVCGLFPLELIE